VHLPKPFLDVIASDNFTVELDHYKTRMPSALHRPTNICLECDLAIEDDCFQDIRVSQIWHVGCFRCLDCCQISPYASSNSPQQPLSACRSCGIDRPQTIQHVTQLQQYRHSLWVALARLMTTMKMEFHALHGINFGRRLPSDGHEGAAQSEEHDLAAELARLRLTLTLPASQIERTKRVRDKGKPLTPAKNSHHSSRLTNVGS
jgi:hypothetical protein